MYIICILLIFIVFMYCLYDFSIEKNNKLNNNKSNIIVNNDHFIIDNKKKLSRTCPHAGCKVNYNNTKNEFVCPCHNSRFKINGELIEGPANSDLAPYP